MQALEMIKGLLFIVAVYMHIFYCSTARVCVSPWLTSLPFPLSLLPTKLTKNWKLESKVLPSYKIFAMLLNWTNFE